MSDPPRPTIPISIARGSYGDCSTDARLGRAARLIRTATAFAIRAENLSAAEAVEAIDQVIVSLGLDTAPLDIVPAG